MYKILLVEDDKLLNDGIAYAFEQDGYRVLQAYTGEQAKKLLDNRPDLAILDILLPDTNGLELCRHIRKKQNTTVIFLTAQDTEQDILEGFREGGDDYITKPFSVPVLKEKVKVVLKRAGAQGNLYIRGNIVFDGDKLVLTKNGVEIPLTPIEVKLMKLFIENRGKVLTRLQIIDRIWDIEGDFVDENALSVNIRRLRSKIEDDPARPLFIKTVFGIGYLWGDDS